MPDKSEDNIINISTMNSPLGEILIAERNSRICVIEFTGNRRVEKAVNLIAGKFTGKIQNRRTAVLNKAENEMRRYFDGSLRNFDLPLELNGTSFQVEIWDKLRSVPFGKTVTYGWLAEKTGNSGKSRAVGGAVGRNYLAIAVPCHRVIGKNGSLTGFGGGLWRKEWLLKHEGAIYL